MSCKTILGQQRTRASAEAAFCPVSDHGAPDFLCGRKTDPDLTFIFVIGPHLDNNPADSAIFSVPDIQKLGPLFQPSELGIFSHDQPKKRVGRVLRGQNLTAFSAATCQHLTTGLRSHTRAKAVATLANQF